MAVATAPVHAGRDVRRLLPHRLPRGATHSCDNLGSTEAMCS